MKTNQLFYLALVTLILSTFSCKKYDQDGQLLHFRKPEKRLEGLWEMDSFENLDCIECIGELTSTLYGSNNLQLEFDFDKDGDVMASNTTDNIDLEGKWEFNGDKSVLTMTFDKYQSADTNLTNANVVFYWKILELELDDFQIYQFREYTGTDINQYAYYMKLEKK